MHKCVGGNALVRKVLVLASLGATALLGPVLVGMLNATAARAQVPAGISGTWKVTSSWSSGDQNNQIGLVMLLRQEGNEITGSLGPSADNQPLLISNGKIDGSAVSFDVGTAEVKLSIKFQLHEGKAGGNFSTINQQGVAIQGTGTGQVQADHMTFEWSATRRERPIQGKLEFMKTEK